MQASRMPVEIFYAYAREDEALRDELEKHLTTLQRQGLIMSWHDRKIVPGSDWAQEIDTHLATASIILLLISPDFLASEYCYGVEMQRAMARHERGDAHVLPIILRPVHWQTAPFASLQGLPRDMKPVTSWPNRDEAFEDIVRGIHWTVEHLYGNISEVAPIPFVARSLPLSDQDRQDRQHFLTYLRTIYRYVVEQSLQGTTFITLGLQTQPEALEQVTQRTFRHLGEAEETLPLGASIEEAYNQAGGELLILGESGAGKSTLLVHLAQHLLLKAQLDEHQLLPVILNLSSWTQKRRPLHEWLVEELFTSYKVPRKLGRQWVQEGRLLLLLDGLDEVAASVRGACVDALNAYRRDHLVPLVVCSRITEYFTQQRRLSLHRAVVIQPLTGEQVDSYLESVGPALSAVRTTLQKNVVLRELASLPLMLNMLIRVYRDAPVASLPEGGSPEEQQQQVFASYVQRVLPANQRSTHPEPLLKRLTWLAQQMQQHSLTTLYLEQLQPDWLSSRWMQWAYKWLAVRLPGVFAGMLVGLAVALLFGGDVGISPIALGFILPGGWLGGVLSRESGTQQLMVNQEKTKNRGRSRLLFCLGTGLLFGLTFGLSTGLELGQLLGLKFGVISGVGGGVGVGLSVGFGSILLQVFFRGRNTVEVASQTLPAWRRLIKSKGVRRGLLLGLTSALLVGGGVGLLAGLSSGFVMGLRYGLNAGLVIGLLFGLIICFILALFWGLYYGLIGGVLGLLLVGKGTTVQLADKLIWSRKSLGESLRSREHVSTSIQVAAFTGCISLIAGLGTSLVIVLLVGLSKGLSFELLTGLIAALSGGLSYWLIFGLFQGVSSETIEDRYRLIPNQGIRDSAFNGFVLGLISTVITGLSGGLVTGLNDKMNRDYLSAFNDKLSGGNTLNQLHNGLNDALIQSLGGLGHSVSYGLMGQLISGLIFGLCIGLLAGLLKGGLACWRHYMLRLLLCRTGMMPWNYTRFLDEAARHILLHRVWGGYTFPHRLFQDYISSLDD
jgi:energy-coupling factor transporter ATP-binding protein EcfA2